MTTRYSRLAGAMRKALGEALAEILDELASGNVDRELAAYRLSGPRFRVTPEGGYAVLLTNKTGAPSVKGSIVTASPAVDNAVSLQVHEYEAVGAIYEDGVADGSDVWVVIGGRAQVLLKDNTAATHGNWLAAADTDGRAADIGNAGGGLPAADNHFKEIGHCLESVTAGTNKLAWALLHFN